MYRLAQAKVDDEDFKAAYPAVYLNTEVAPQIKCFKAAYAAVYKTYDAGPTAWIFKAAYPAV